MTCLVRQYQMSSKILHVRQQSHEMQLMAFRWKNFHLLLTSDSIVQRQAICQELTTVRLVLLSTTYESTMYVFI
jgi:hypothetical protein